jgi:DnaJ-class molecular chaperone
MGIPTYKNEKNIGDLVIKFNILYPKENDEKMKKYDKVFKKIFS